MRTEAGQRCTARVMRSPEQPNATAGASSTTRAAIAAGVTFSTAHYLSRNYSASLCSRTCGEFSVKVSPDNTVPNITMNSGQSDDVSIC
jgi:hypothetical protein